MNTTVRFLLLLAVLGLPAAARGQVHVVGSLRRHMELAQGDERQGEVLVHNPGTRPETVRAYLTGYRATAEGRTFYGDPVAAYRSSASWIHLAPREQEIAPGATASFHYVIRVPRNPELAGSYWSMLMVEPVDPGTLDPPKAETDRTRLGIRTVTRTGIHMATHIGDSGSRDLKFIDRKLVHAGGSPVLQLDIENTGERYLRLALWAELFDGRGLSAGRFEGGGRGLYPADSARVPIKLSGMPPGAYQVLVVADNGDDAVFGARYDLEIPE